MSSDVGCMRYLSLVSVLSAADDHQLSRCVEKQCVAPSGTQSNVSKAYFSHLNEIYAVFRTFVELYIATRLYVGPSLGG